MVITESDLWEALGTITDPEIPVLSLVEMKVIRSVSVGHDRAHVVISPTFVGCPAMDMMKSEIRNKLVSFGINHITIETTFSPPWSTDMLSEETREKLRLFGIAPPPQRGANLQTDLTQPVRCPFCSSEQTVLESPFGATLCRQLFFCQGCRQSFERFKPL